MKAVSIIAIVIALFLLQPSLKAQVSDPQPEDAGESTQRQQWLNARADLEKMLMGGKGNLKLNDWQKRYLWMHRTEIELGPDMIARLHPRSQQFLTKQRPEHIESQNGWAPLGPIEIATSYDSTNTEGIGRINCVAFHPANRDIFWIGASSGGVWKTADGGKSWIPQGEDLANLQISSIAIDPSNPDIIYLASGDNDGSSPYNFDSPLGIIKSIDGGSTWSETSLSSDTNFSYSNLRKIIINSQTPNELATAGVNGFWRSTDYGSSWAYTKTARVYDLVSPSQEPNTLYVATSSGIRKSSDFGTTWKTLTTGMNYGEIGRITMAVAPTDKNFIYVLSAKKSDNGFHSLYASTDAGTTWTRRAHYSTGPNIMGWLDGDSTDTYSGSAGQGFYDLTLLVDPMDKNTIYSGGVDIWMSTDGGVGWDMASFWANYFGVSIHADHHFAAVNPLDQNMYWCNDGGIFRTKQIKAGSKSWMQYVDRKTDLQIPNHPAVSYPTIWEDLSSGLSITEFYKVASSKNNPDYAAAGAQDNSCFYYHTGKWITYIAGWDGMSVMIDHVDPKVIYGTYQLGGFNRSDDGGVSVHYGLADTLFDPATQLDQQGGWVTPIGMDPLDSKTVFIGLRNLWTSHSKGKDWVKILPLDTLSAAIKNHFVIDRIKNSYSDPKYMAVARPGWVQMPADLWITKDGAKTWISPRVGLPLDTFSVSGIEYDGVNPEKMWIACSDGYIYQSTNAGSTWNKNPKAVPGISINALVHYQNGIRNPLYVATSSGVYFTNDTMSNWLPINANLPTVPVSDLSIQEMSGQMYASTYGRGVWVLSLIPGSSTGVRATGTESSSYDVFPNPSSEKVSVRYRSTQEQSDAFAPVTILDVRGRKVWSGKAERTDTGFGGDYNVDLGSGVYFVKTVVNGASLVRKILISR